MAQPVPTANVAFSKDLFVHQVQIQRPQIREVPVARQWQDVVPSGRLIALEVVGSNPAPLLIETLWKQGVSFLVCGL